MTYEIEFKPKSIKDIRKVPKTELGDYEDLKLLRQAKSEEASAPSISLHEEKSIYKIKTANKTTSR